MISVLFVCMGNICRSPAAEAILRKRVDEAGLNSVFTIDSAAIGAWHIGETAHPQTLRTLAKHGISYTGRARQVNAGDREAFDYIFLADREVQSAFRRVQPAGMAQVELLLSGAYQAGTVATDEIPDPNYTGQFDLVHELIEHGCEEILQRIRAEHQI